MIHVVLWEPEIPPNTGNVGRLCAATGSRLHLVGRLGFRLDDKHLKRAGLDYWPSVDLHRHATWDAFLSSWAEHPPSADGGVPPKLWLIDNPAPTPYPRADIRDGDALVFGSESKGLPPELRDRYSSQLVGIPMPSGAVRSLNLATAVGVVLYDALRRLHDW